MSRFALLSVIAIVCLNGVYSNSTVRSFPKGFQFGSSTSAFQIEGAWDVDGKGPSIWDHVTHQNPSHIVDGSNSDISADSYHNYKRDVELMTELDLDFYRFSVSWPRILPTGFSNQINQPGVDYYNNLIDKMLENGIVPFLTIYHWDLPIDLQKLGGWANPLIVDWFADYAKVLFDKFGDRVKYWMTLNEPTGICYHGYGSDSNAPFLNITGIAEYICAKNVLLAHAKVYRLYDTEYRKTQNGEIGISISCSWYEPATDSIEDQQAAVDARRFDCGHYANPIFSKDGDFPVELKNNIALKSAEQGYLRSRLPELSEYEVEFIKGTADFFGLNTYSSKLAYRNSSLEGMFPTPSYMDDMGAILVKDDSWPQGISFWLQEVPWGLKNMLLEIKELYDNPRVYITENGWSTAAGLIDDDRIQYIRNYLAAMLDAIDEGCNVKAYAVWSLLDSFEWTSGYSERFGIYEVDFSSTDRTRTPRKSAFVYKEIIRSRELDFSYEPEEFIQQKKLKLKK